MTKDRTQASMQSMHGYQPVTEGYQPRPVVQPLQNGFQPAAANAHALHPRPPSGGSSIAKPTTAKKA